MAQPHPGVATIRTPRTRALEIGTKREGFEGAISYCAQCGHPLQNGLPHGHYASQSQSPTPSYVDFQQKPFK